MTKLMIWGIAVSFVIAAAGCPKDEDSLSPREACEDVAAVLCERVYACLSPAEVAKGGFPTTEAACVAQIEQKEGCAAQTTANACDAGETFQARTASQCVDQLEDVSCAQLRAGELKTAAPACDRVCEGD